MLDTSTEFGQRAERRLNEASIIWLTTVRKDGMPQPLPVWFLWDGEKVLIFTQPGAQKLNNLDHSPKAALHLDSDGRGGDIIVLEGEAEVLAEDLSALDVEAYIDKYRAGLDRLNTTPEAFAKSYRVPILFTPDRIRGH